jgi:hypothetical protein
MDKFVSFLKAMAAIVPALCTIIASITKVFDPELTAIGGMLCAVVLFCVSLFFLNHANPFVWIPSRVAVVFAIILFGWLGLLLSIRLAGQPSPWGVEDIAASKNYQIKLAEIGTDNGKSIAKGKRSVNPKPGSDRLVVDFGVSGPQRDKLTKLQIASVQPDDGLRKRSFKDPLETGLAIENQPSLTAAGQSKRTFNMELVAIGKNETPLPPIIVTARVRFYSETLFWRLRTCLYWWYEKGKQPLQSG